MEGDFANKYTGIRGITENNPGKRACVLLFAKRNRETEKKFTGAKKCLPTGRKIFLERHGI